MNKKEVNITERKNPGVDIMRWYRKDAENGARLEL